MAKVTKSLLKQIVKECLVEILIEGMGDEDVDVAPLTESAKPKQKKSQYTRKKHPTDSITYNQAINASVSQLTSDPIMSEIFSDTAKSTLAEQRAAEGRRNPVATDPASRQVANSEPSELFPGAGNWASLAFAEKNPK